MREIREGEEEKCKRNEMRGQGRDEGKGKIIFDDKIGEMKGLI